MNKYFHNLLKGISVLPALLVMPAVAYDVVGNANLNDEFADGVITDGIIYSWEDGNSYDLSFTTPTINISNASGHAVNAWWGSELILGDEETTTSVTLSGSKRGISIFDANTAVAINSTDSVLIEGATNIGALVSDSNAELDIFAKNVTITGAFSGLQVQNNAFASINNPLGNLTVSATDGNAIVADPNSEYDANDHFTGYTPNSGGTIDIVTGNLTATGVDTGIMANYQGGQITITASGDVNVSAKESAIHAGFGTANVTKAKADTSFIDITANNINLTADETAISAMSNGWIDLNGNLTVNAKNAILARGYSTVNINASGENTVKMNGNVNFNFYSNPGSSGNSNSPIDAYVNVNLAGNESYWTGNTLIEYYYKDAPAAEILDVQHFNLSLSNGATWNATKITDTNETVIDEETGHECSEGQYYIALNNLDIMDGTVNILDTTRGITVENATVSGATFNGGPLNIGTMTVNGVENTFNTNISGDTLVLANGAIMDIGTNSIVADTMSLNGTLNATLLNTNKFASLEVGEFAADAGSISLTLKGVGDYKVFRDAIFDDEKVAFVYDETLFAAPVWNDAKDTITVSMRAAEDIAKDTGVDTGTAATVSHIAEAASNSDSVQLQALSLNLQEKLADGDTASVEHATAAIHPETESVVQSVSTSMHNTIASLAAGRMSMPMVGRNGGDVKMTSGGVWVQGIYNKSKQNDSFNGYTRGVAGGLDATLNKVWTVGAGYAFAHSDVAGTARDTEIDSSSVFVYGQYKPSAWYMNAVANYTMADYTETGSALGIGLSSNYDVDSFGANVATGYNFAGGVTPELALRYMHINASDYVNSLGVKNELDDSDYLTASLGTKYAFNVKMAKRLNLRPELRYGIKYDVLSDKQVATVTMPGLNSYALNGERLSRIGGEFGIGLTMNYRGLDVSVNYDIEAREDYTSQSGRLKFRYNF